MFWKKPKPQPWYRKLWNEWKQLAVSLTTVFGVLGGAYSYVAVDVHPFVNTTGVVAVATDDTIYVRVTAETEIREQTFVIINVDGEQVKALVYPKGIREGEINIEIPIPFTSAKEKYLDVNVEIVVVGLRTLFQPTTLETTIQVKRQEVTNETTNGNSSSTNIVRPGTGISV